MAILVNYGYDSSINNVNPDERYVGETGCIRALLDTTINDRLLFESIIASDFAEVQAIRESASEEEIQSLSEASVEGFFARLKEFIKKIWEKFVGIIKSFLTFIQAHLIRDNKALVKKYDLDIRKKDLSKMKYKWSRSKRTGSVISSVNVTGEELYNNSYKLINEIRKRYAGEGHKAAEQTSYLKETDTKEKALQAIFDGDKNVEWDNYLDTIWSHYYDDEEEMEGLDNSLYENIKGVLENFKDVIRGFEKLKTDTDKYFKERLKEAENNIKNKGKTDGLVTGYTVISVAQEVQAKALNASIVLAKRRVKQCRALFIKAASYRGVGESTILTEAMIDVDGQHVDEMFETMSI